MRAVNRWLIMFAGWNLAACCQESACLRIPGYSKSPPRADQDYAVVGAMNRLIPAVSQGRCSGGESGDNKCVA